MYMVTLWRKLPLLCSTLCVQLQLWPIIAAICITPTYLSYYMADYFFVDVILPKCF